MLSLEAYLTAAAQEPDWAPGWNAVQGQLDALYPGGEEAHLAPAAPLRAAFGGDEYLDAISVHVSPHGYRHLCTFGMTALYADPSSYGQEVSGWGYEMTAKVIAATAEEALWMVSALSDMARYTWTKHAFFEPFQTFHGRGPLRNDVPTPLTSFLIVPDTELAGVDSVHGRVDFLQMVGITEQECLWVLQEPADALARGMTLADRIASAFGPALVTDLARSSLI